MTHPSRRLLVSILLLIGVTACASRPPVIDDFADIRARASLALPVTVSEDGGMSVEVSLDGGTPVAFLIDTGATASAIFDDYRRLLELPLVPDRQVRVSGFIDRGTRPVTRTQTLALGDEIYADHELVVLDSRRFGISRGAAGLIGLDILRDYTLAFSVREQMLYLLPAGSAGSLPLTRGGWVKVELTTDPYETGFDKLYFAEVVIDERRVPGLIDTGSAFSAMNWKEVQAAELKEVQRYLRQRWTAQGAIGTFYPLALGTFERFRLGTYYYYDREIVLHDYDSLNITGAAGRPLFVAGGNMFSDKDFIIDFEAMTLLLSRISGDPASHWNYEDVIRNRGVTYY